jgi:2-dehydro-3-deoxygalactonokinase
MKAAHPGTISEPGLIALDWGTSSLRGWLFNSSGHVLDRREAPLGILAVPDGRFAETFANFCAPWLADFPCLPVVASGMIGSRQGWREAPYLDTPAALGTLAAGLLSLDDLAGRPFRVVPGLVTRTSGGWPDVLRGEETQVFGLLGVDPASGPRLFVLPGTHSKWVLSSGDIVTGFHTQMTGELYAVLQTHSILGRLWEEPARPDTPEQLSAFDQGVDRALAAPGTLAHLLFTVRSEALLGERPPAQLSAYLSGLLIGGEIAGALQIVSPTGSRRGWDDLPAPCIVAAAPLASLYERALRLSGASPVVAQSEASRDGLFALAIRSGLLR